MHSHHVIAHVDEKGDTRYLHVASNSWDLHPAAGTPVFGSDFGPAILQLVAKNNPHLRGKLEMMQAFITVRPLLTHQL
jgi:hypothetical protein